MAMAEGGSIEERVNAMEDRQKRIEERLARMEEKLEITMNDKKDSEVNARMERIEKVMKQPKVSFTAVVKGTGKATRDAQRIQQGGAIPKKLAVNPATRVEKKPEAEGNQSRDKKSDGPSFAEVCGKFGEGTVMVVGDSMVRGIGKMLNTDNEMFGKLDFGGARIEDIEEKVRLIGDKPESHMVFMVGTNNLLKDHPEEIALKYKALMKTVKERKYRKVSMIGILARLDRGRTRDWNEYIDCKRYTVNMELEALCKENGIEFLDIEIDRRRNLDWKGLHLNYHGQDAVAKKVFVHCVNSLN